MRTLELASYSTGTAGGRERTGSAPASGRVPSVFRLPSAVLPSASFVVMNVLLDTGREARDRTSRRLVLRVPRTRWSRSGRAWRSARTRSSSTSGSRATATAVVIHDPTLERTTDGTGAVSARTARELQRSTPDIASRGTAAGRSRFAGAGSRSPRSSSCCRPFRACPMIVEVKAREASAEVQATAARARARKRAASSGRSTKRPSRRFAARRSRTARRAAKSSGCTRVPCFPGGPSRLPYQALAIPPSFDGIPLPVMRFARMARRAGATTHVWTVDDPAQARRYWAGAVNGIITNDPGTILASAGRARSPSRPLSPDSLTNGRTRQEEEGQLRERVGRSEGADAPAPLVARGGVRADADQPPRGLRASDEHQVADRQGDRAAPHGTARPDRARGRRRRRSCRRSRRSPTRR